MSRNRAEGVPETGSGLAAKKKKSPYQNKHSYVELGLLSAKQEQAKTRDDYEESKLEILSAVKELVPGPQALSHRHSQQFEGHYAQENAAETHDWSRTLKKRVEVDRGGDEESVHARVTCLTRFRRIRWLGN